MNSNDQKHLGEVMPKLDDPFVCPHCGFSGIIMDTIERPFRDNQGRHTRGGMRFSCKRCDEVVLEVINVIS